MMRDTDFAWLACAIDSEGSLFAGTIYKKHSRKYLGTSIFLSISNADRQYMEHVQSLLAGLICSPVRLLPYTGKNPFGKKPLYRIYVSNRRAIQAVLKAVLPWLIVKRHRAQRVLRYIAARGVYRARKGITPKARELGRRLGLEV